MNLIQKTVTVGIIASYIALNPVAMYAQSDHLVAVPSQTLASASATRQGAKQIQELQIVQAKGDRLISMRLTSLQDLATQIAAMKRLSSDQKDTYATQLTTERAGLTTLKAKIDADTDLSIAKADVSSIVTTYRVYAYFEPEIRILVACDRLMTVSDQLSNYANKLSLLVATAGKAGKDVIRLNVLLSDMQAKIADAKQQEQTIVSTLHALTSANFPGSNQTFQTARTQLKTATQDLKTAFQDGLQIRQSLKALKLVTPAASPSAQ